MKKKTGLLVILSVIFFIFLSPLKAAAQNVPSGQESSAAASRFENEAERRKAALQTKGVKAPQIEIEKEKEAAPQVSGATFVLRDIKVTGSTLFKPEVFPPLYQNYIGKEVTFKEINEIVEAIKGKYKEQGFLTTNVYIPEQQITGGVVEIRVLEGKMGKLTIEGNKWFTRGLIEKYIHTKKNEILNIKTLQRDLLRLNQNPDLEVKTVIAAGEEPQTSDIVLKVTDKFPYHVASGADNQGQRTTGKYRSSISGRSTNMTANNDFVYYNASISAGAAGNFMTYVVPIDTYGLKAGFDFSYFTSKTGREFLDYDIIGNTWDYIPHITGEIYLSEDLQISADSGLNIKSTLKTVHSDVTVEEQLRILYYRMDISKTDPLFGGGQTTFSPQVDFSIGNGFLGAAKADHTKASRASTGGYYFKYAHTLRRVQRLPWESYAVLKHQLQLASYTLPSSEQFQLGGESSIRGYPEGDYTSDIGASVGVDWIFPMYLIPKDYKLPRDETPLRNEIQPVIFMDLGGGKLIRRLPGERPYKFIMGIGGGVKINLYNRLSARLEWAHAIGADPTANSGPSNFHIVANFEI